MGAIFDLVNAGNEKLDKEELIKKFQSFKSFFEKAEPPEKELMAQVEDMVIKELERIENAENPEEGAKDMFEKAKSLINAYELEHPDAKVSDIKTSLLNICRIIKECILDLRNFGNWVSQVNADSSGWYDRKKQNWDVRLQNRINDLNTQVDLGVLLGKLKEKDL